MGETPSVVATRPPLITKSNSVMGPGAIGWEVAASVLQRTMYADETSLSKGELTVSLAMIMQPPRLLYLHYV
jgi:hypothetical protein